MAGTLRLNYRSFTYRQLLVMYEASLLAEWDRTTTTNVILSTLSVQLHNMMAKSKRKILSFYDLHPLRSKPKTSQGLKITPQNIGVLKEIFSK